MTSCYNCKTHYYRSRGEGLCRSCREHFGFGDHLAEANERIAELTDFVRVVAAADRADLIWKYVDEACELLDKEKLAGG